MGRTDAGMMSDGGPDVRVGASWPPPASRTEAERAAPRVGRLCARVLYQDTDQARIVHHASYFRYLEAARLELWRGHGFDYARFERETGLGLPVAEARLRYRSAARFDDEITVETWASSASRASVWLDSVIRRGETLILEASVRLACVCLADGSIRRIPDALLDACFEGGHGL